MLTCVAIKATGENCLDTLEGLLDVVCSDSSCQPRPWKFILWSEAENWEFFNVNRFRCPIFDEKKHLHLIPSVAYVVDLSLLPSSVSSSRLSSVFYFVRI